MLDDIARKLATNLEDTDAANLRVVLAIFCKTHVENLRELLIGLSQKWSEFAGEHMGWQYVGANSTRLSKSKSDALIRIQREIECANGENKMSFLWQGPNPFAADYHLRGWVRGVVHNEKQARSSLTEMVLPCLQITTGNRW